MKGLYRRAKQHYEEDSPEMNKKEREKNNIYIHHQAFIVT
jgi:hypothetical protein